MHVALLKIENLSAELPKKRYAGTAHRREGGRIGS
jgi:hypothetical protein